MIAVAAGVVLIGGGIAAALFSGALGGGDAKSGQSSASKEKTTAVAEAATEAAKTTEATTEAATTTTTTAAATTTTVATTTTKAAETKASAEAAEAEAASGESGQDAVFPRKKSPIIEALFRDMKVQSYISDDVTPRGAVEETLVNFTNGLLGGTRNISSAYSRGDANTFGMEISVALNLSDAYVQEIGEMIFGSYVDPTIKDALRLAGASEIKLSTEFSGDIVDSMWNPVLAMNADWLVKARSLLSLNAYADLENIIVAAPDLTKKVFRMDSTLVPTNMLDFDALQSQLGNIENLGKYVTEFTPHVQKMLIAAVKELDIKYGGKADIKLGAKTVSTDAIDVSLTEETVLKAAIAAMLELKSNQAALDLIVRAWNEDLYTLANMPQFDKQEIIAMISNAIAISQDNLGYVMSDDVYQIRLYMIDGAMSGMALLLPYRSEVTSMGCVVIPDAGYSFWTNDLLYEEYEEFVKNPQAQDPGCESRYEIYGVMSEGAGGISGNICLNIRENGDEFNEELMSFSNLEFKVLYGIPAVTGRLTVKMADLLKAFAGKESSEIYDISNIAYTLSDATMQAYLKDLEFSLDLSSSGSDYKMTLEAANPSMDSKVSVSVKGYYTNDTITPPKGNLYDILAADPNEYMVIYNEVMTNIDAKIDALTSAGYDLQWLKPVITGLISDALGLSSEGGGDDGAGAGAASMSYKGYILENSSYEELDPDVLRQLPPEMLRLARAEIFAKNGWVFEEVDLQLYFNSQDWYTPKYDNENVTLNDIETANNQLLLELEQELGE